MSCAQGEDGDAIGRRRAGAAHASSTITTTACIMAATLPCVLVSRAHMSMNQVSPLLYRCSPVALHVRVTATHPCVIRMMFLSQAQLLFLACSPPSTTHPPDITSTRSTRNMCRMGSHMDTYTLLSWSRTTHIQARISVRAASMVCC